MKYIFDDVLEIKNGKNQKSVENPEGKYPIYGSGGVMGYADDYICSADTVIIGRKGSINNPIFVKEPFWNVDTAFGLEANRELLHPKYLFYFCKKFDFEKLNKTVTIPSLTKSDLLKINIEVPEMLDQENVINRLEKIEQIIELRREELIRLDELIKARFVELFGDVICNEKRWPAYALSDISESRLGKMLDAKQQTGEHQHPYLANFNVQWFRFDFSQLNEMDFNEADRKEFELQEGDLLVTEGGEVGRCAVWKNEISSCYFQKALHRVRCDKQIVLPEYLAWWFKQHADYNSFEDVVGGKTSIPHLTGVKLKNLMVVVPDMALQRQFVDFSKQVDKSKVAVQESLDETQKLFDSLMQEYFG